MRRSFALERIDTGDYTLPQYHHCLYQLGRVGKLLGGERATFRALDSRASDLNSVLEVGCGGGYMAAAIAKRYPHLHVTGIDINPEAIAHAERHTLPNLTFEPQAAPALPKNCGDYDLITANLVCHHMDDETVVAFLRQAHQSARKAVLVNDLHRHPLALAAYYPTAPLLFRNRLITEDGTLSIRRSFTRSDWIRYVAESGIPKLNCELRWNFPFRWTLWIETNGVSGRL